MNWMKILPWHNPGSFIVPTDFNLPAIHIGNSIYQILSFGPRWESKG